MVGASKPINQRVRKKKMLYFEFAIMSSCFSIITTVHASSRKSWVTTRNATKYLRIRIHAAQIFVNGQIWLTQSTETTSWYPHPSPSQNIFTLMMMGVRVFQPIRRHSYGKKKKRTWVCYLQDNEQFLHFIYSYLSVCMHNKTIFKIFYLWPNHI